MSLILDSVISDLQAREEKGIETYQTTMDRKDLSLEDWENHLYEELLDAVLYLKKIKHEKRNGDTSKDIEPVKRIGFDK